jgi:hypothetical protein
MMEGISVPSGAPVPRKGLPPEGASVRLADGRYLRHTDHVRGLTEPSAGYVYDGPKRLRVVATLDLTAAWGPLLHVSLSYPKRLPDWETVRLVKDAFYGDVDACMILPRREDYVNVHQFVFHLFQLPQKWGIR